MTTRRVLWTTCCLLSKTSQASRALYTAALEPLGYCELSAKDDGVQYGADGMDGFAISEGSPVTSGAHVAFAAPDRHSVDAFFTAAISQGATPRGTPGRWVQYSDSYYAAYAYDLHGNNIEAVWHASAPVREAPRRVLATILSTDIVGSTEHLSRIGDGEWRAILQRHHEITRRELKHHGGREIDTAGDGFLISFERPGAAIACAVAVVEAVRELGIEVRAGIHTGECEQIDNKLTGIAVHVTARVASAAGPGEVLVSKTVRDLVAGSDDCLDDAGHHKLKGVPGTWRLYMATK